MPVGFPDGAHGMTREALCFEPCGAEPVEGENSTELISPSARGKNRLGFILSGIDLEKISIYVCM